MAAIRSSSAAARTSAGARDDFDDVELELDWCTPFQRAVVEALRRVPYGETVTYGELAALAGHPNAQRAAGHVLRGEPLRRSSSRATASSRRAGSARTARSGVDYKRRLLELEGVAVSLSEDVRARARRDRAAQACCRLAELSALVRAAGASTCAARAGSACTSRSASAAVARRAFALLRGYGVAVRDPHVPPPRVRAGDALPAPPATTTRASVQALNEAGILGDAARARSSGRRGGSSAGRAAGAAYLRGAFLAAGSV